MFLYAKSKKETISICNNILSNIYMHIEKRKVVEIVPYWKIEGVFQIELSITLKNNSIDSNDLERFLKTLCNLWLSYGEPIDEILITRKLDGSIIDNEKIEMINIFLDNEKIIAKCMARSKWKDSKKR